MSGSNFIGMHGNPSALSQLKSGMGFQPAFPRGIGFQPVKYPLKTPMSCTVRQAGSLSHGQWKSFIIPRLSVDKALASDLLISAEYELS